MQPLIHELYELSDNTPLFDHLRKSGDLTTLSKRLAKSAPKGRKPDLLASIRTAFIPALEANDLSPLKKLIDEGNTSVRISILGELILTLHALSEGKHAGEPVERILKLALWLALELAGALEANPPQDANDPELLAHGVAMREWAHLFARYYKAKDVPAYDAELLMIRARATNTTLSSWAHLVGAAMVDIARALESIGNVEMATRCYHGVRMDVRYLIKRPDDVYPEFETAGALFWLQRACEERIRLVPDDEDAKTDLQAVRALRQERGFPDALSAPRFGPIARTYLARIPYLARIVRDINTIYDKERENESIAAICQRYGCLSTDVQFYVSAIGSYYIRGMLAGVHMMYDEAHQEVFAAIDYLNREDAGMKEP